MPGSPLPQIVTGSLVPGAALVWRWLAWVLLLAALGGCTTLPRVDREAITSNAIPLSKQTTLGRIASAYRPAEDQSLN